MEDKDKPIEGHDYDGIQELGNDLPKWWLYIFYASIVFSAGYLYYYHLGGPGKSVVALFEEERKQAPSGGGDGSFTEAEVNVAATEQGKTIFAQKCIVCHGAQGQGLVGPNLTDEYWLHGAKLHEIARVISEGVPEKGMIGWKSQMSRAEVIQVALYVKSLKGTSPSGAKAPQGNKEN